MSEVHVAGPMVNLVQRCSRCGHILSDYRNAAWEIGNEPKGWGVGHFVEKDGNYTSSHIEQPGLLCNQLPN